MRVDRMSKTEFGPAEWFTGQVWIDEIAESLEPSRLRAHSVHFAPGSRTAWHRAGDTVHVEPGDRTGMARRRRIS